MRIGLIWLSIGVFVMTLLVIRWLVRLENRIERLESPPCSCPSGMRYHALNCPTSPGEARRP